MTCNRIRNVGKLYVMMAEIFLSLFVENYIQMKIENTTETLEVLMNLWEMRFAEALNAGRATRS